MDNWDIETFFSIGITTAEHTPEIAKSLFVWPNFIDGDVHRDYGESKIIPILFTGSMIPLYPWRQKIHKIVSNCYPSFSLPHSGYDSNSPIMIYGEQYARTINASWFAPTCGTIAKEVVRKHFEIAGCKACLITEKNQSLKAAGFVDMQNCVFADEKDILDKLNYLFKNKHALEKIINAGYDLVQSYHTLKQRDQIFQWLQLYKKLKPNQRIVQENPFKPLSIVDKSLGIENKPIICNGLNSVLLHKGNENLLEGKYDDAETFYLKCLNYIPGMSEPRLKLAICSLYKGNPTGALNWIMEPIKNNFGIYGAVDPDPVEWAYFIISLLCQGKLNESIVRAYQFPTLHHPELDRTRWVINYLQNKENQQIDLDGLSKRRYSIHQLPQISFEDWINNICRMLKACQQYNYSEILSKAISSKQQSIKRTQKKISARINVLKKNFRLIRIKWLEELNRILEALHAPNPTPMKQALLPFSEIDYIIRFGRWAKLNSVKKAILDYLSYLNNYHKANSSSTLPEKNAEFFKTFYHLLQEENIKTAIIIGASTIDVVNEAISVHNQSKDDVPTVYHINFSNTPGLHSQKKYVENIKFYQFVFNSPESFSKELNDYVKKIKNENDLNCFDLILIDNSEFKNEVELYELHGAKFIIINGINSSPNYRYKQKLIKDLNYHIVAQNPLDVNAYIVLKRENPQFKSIYS
jgi:hypothetical protein